MKCQHEQRNKCIGDKNAESMTEYTKKIGSEQNLPEKVGVVLIEKMMETCLKWSSQVICKPI